MTAIRSAHQEHVAQAELGNDTLDEDLMFHIRIAEASNNLLLRSVIGLVGPHILRFSHEHVTYRNGRPLTAIREHAEILDALEKRSVEDATVAMRSHLVASWGQFQLDGATFLAATPQFYGVGSTEEEA